MATETARSDTGAGGVSVIRRVLLDNGALSALVVLVVAMSLLSGDFLTTQNLLNVGVQAAVTAILAFGVTFVIVSAGIDLSVGSVAALSATVLAWSATSAGVPVVLAVVLAILTGIACGFVNGASSRTANSRRSSRRWRCSRSPEGSRSSSRRAARSRSPTPSRGSATRSAAGSPYRSSS